MGLYLDGIKDGSNIESWAAVRFFGHYEVRDGRLYWIQSETLPPLDTKLNLKQLAEHKFLPWLGAKPQSDYYILRQY